MLRTLTLCPGLNSLIVSEVEESACAITMGVRAFVLLFRIFFLQVHHSRSESGFLLQHDSA